MYVLNHFDVMGSQSYWIC